MNDTDLLTDRLHHLGDRAPVPDVPTTDDLRRGRGRLRRRRLAAVAGTAAVAVTAGGVALAAGTGADPHTRVDPATAPVAQQPSAPRAAPDPVAQPGKAPSVRIGGVKVGAQASRATTLQDLLALSSALEQTEGKRVYGLLAIGQADTWAAARANTCPTGWTCTPIDVEGAQRARRATDGTTTQAVAQFPSGVAILTLTDADHFPAGLPYAGAMGKPQGPAGGGS